MQCTRLILIGANSTTAAFLGDSNKRLLVPTDRFIGYQVERIQMISKILVPHDGTEMSDKAFEKAVELAKVFKAELVLLHVIEYGIEPLPTSLILDDKDLINRARRSARRQLEKGWDKMVEVKTHEIENDKVDLTGECRYGSAAEQILRSAKSNKIDMIVMGSRRLQGILKIKALGSVARKVSELADCSVLIVH